MADSMDQLVASLGASCEVDADPFDTNKPHPHFADYAHLRKPASLMGDQDKRRLECLKRQKSKRDKVYNLQRQLRKEFEAVDDSDDEAPETYENLHKKSTETTPKKWTFRHELMLSEWLVDVPTDLEENWLLKPCPKGQRMMVVATQGTTKAYTKSGYVVATFSSGLPGGHRASRQGITILDCIWDFDNRTYYVLDVLAWNNIELLDCETEFRFYWLKTKLDECPEVTCHSDKNRNAFVPLQSFECSEDHLINVMNRYPMFSEERNKDPGLDGMLFYHKKNLYEHGTTPLVTWLKPFMMEDVLGIKVHESYVIERPESYSGQAAYIKEFEEAAQAKKASYRGKWRKGKTGGKGQDTNMDCAEDCDESKMD
ncbi:snurportin-1 [Thrips palmi]|uniref:Snurportin-1 n=1 Tax=Thrips palmi TaxID=161013 RepID=A0A6P8Z1F1_THRPL|nr:snurportin-1 [Thrips palmi]